MRFLKSNKIAIPSLSFYHLRWLGKLSLILEVGINGLWIYIFTQTLLV